MEEPADPGEVAERIARHAERPGFRISELRMSPTQRVPWHYHTSAQDTFYVLDGSVRITLRDPDEQIDLQPGESSGSGPPRAPASGDEQRQRECHVPGASGDGQLRLHTRHLTVTIFPVTEELPFRPVQRRPPGLLTAQDVAPDLDVAVACGPGGGAVARFPGDRDRARSPRMVQAALGGPGRNGHPASRTCFRAPGVAGDENWTWDRIPTGPAGPTRAPARVFTGATVRVALAILARPTTS